MSSTRWYTLAAALLVLAGCGGGGGSDGGPAVIGHYDVTDAGAWQRYRLTQTGQAETTATMQVIAASGTGFTRRVHTGASAAYTDNFLTVAGGGISILGSRQHDAAGAIAATIGYSPPGRILPGDVTPGASEHATTTISTTSATGTRTDDNTRDLTVNGLEEVTVPLGTFQALKVTTLISTLTGSASATNEVWWAPGVGRVRIVNTVTAPSTSVATYELVSVGTGTPP